MAAPRAIVPLLSLLVAALVCRGAFAQPVDEPSAEGSVPDLVAKLSPERPDPVRLQAVLLLGQLGGDVALQAVARALIEDPYPPVRSSAALALGQGGDVRWVRALAGRLEDDAPLVKAAVRVAIKSLVQRFRDPKENRARYTFHVEVRGLKDRTGADDNDLTVWFQEGVAERLAREPGVVLGDVVDFEPEEAGPSAEPSAPAELAGLVELLVDGGVLEYQVQRDADGARVSIRGDMQVFLEPVHEPVSDRKEAQREELLPVDVSDEEAIEASALPLSRDLFEELWVRLR
jgi:hypothetical protein